MNFLDKFTSALPYDSFLAKYANPGETDAWNSTYARVQLNDQQTNLLKSFTRQTLVLCMAGTWCGDCVAQCPIFRRFEEACPLINIRFVDRDADPELTRELQICGAPRVPQTVFMSEEGKPVGRYGDRTLTKYRQMMGEFGGTLLPAKAEPTWAGVVQDWLNEFERIQYILRLSPHLRQKHGD